MRPLNLFYDTQIHPFYFGRVVTQWRPATLSDALRSNDSENFPSDSPCLCISRACPTTYMFYTLASMRVWKLEHAGVETGNKSDGRHSVDILLL